jgi:ferredoxin, 2Fe-2S
VVQVVFILPDGSRRALEATVGESIMNLATRNLIPGIIGECGGNLSCATCHVYVGEPWYSKLKPAKSEENDMLEGTSEEPTEESRLGCQIPITSELEGIVIRIPASQR